MAHRRETRTWFVRWGELEISKPKPLGISDRLYALKPATHINIIQKRNFKMAD
jgi:hypothetical protein